MKSIERELESSHVKIICRGHLRGLYLNQRCKGCEQDEFNKQCSDYIPQRIWDYGVRN